MVMGATKVLLTAQEFDNYPFEEDKRYELDEGELIEMTRPAYKHNRIVQNLEVDLVVYFRKTRTGEVLNPENLFAISPETRRAPDLSVILGDHRVELEEAKVIHLIPDIAVEVLSPNETTPSVHRKLHQYFDAGIKEVWLIYPETREVELWTGPRLPEIEFAGTTTLISALLPGFEMPLETLFA
jgi:Uma2 family endonuclease